MQHRRSALRKRILQDGLLSPAMAWCYVERSKSQPCTTQATSENTRHATNPDTFTSQDLPPALTPVIVVITDHIHPKITAQRLRTTKPMSELFCSATAKAIQQSRVSGYPGTLQKQLIHHNNRNPLGPNAHPPIPSALTEPKQARIQLIGSGSVLQCRLATKVQVCTAAPSPGSIIGQHPL